MFSQTETSAFVLVGQTQTGDHDDLTGHKSFVGRSIATTSALPAFPLRVLYCLQPAQETPPAGFRLPDN